MIFDCICGVKPPHKAWRRQAAALQVVLLLCACTSKSPEDMVREVIDACQKAAKEHKPGGVMEHIAKDFKDNHGNNRDMLKGILLREMMMNKSLGVYITTNEVTVMGGEASVSLKVVVTGSSGIIPERADGMRVKLTLRKDDGKWMIAHADWTFGSGYE